MKPENFIKIVSFCVDRILEKPVSGAKPLYTDPAFLKLIIDVFDSEPLTLQQVYDKLQKKHLCDCSVSTLEKSLIYLWLKGKLAAEVYNTGKGQISMIFKKVV